MLAKFKVLSFSLVMCLSMEIFAESGLSTPAVNEEQGQFSLPCTSQQSDFVESIHYKATHIADFHEDMPSPSTSDIWFVSSCEMVLFKLILKNLNFLKSLPVATDATTSSSLGTLARMERRERNSAISKYCHQMAESDLAQAQLGAEIAQTTGLSCTPLN